MATNPKKAGRGGRRVGAGRKAFLSDAQMLTVTLEGDQYEAISEIADDRGVSLGAVVREAVATYTARRRRRG